MTENQPPEKWTLRVKIAQLLDSHADISVQKRSELIIALESLIEQLQSEAVEKFKEQGGNWELTVQSIQDIEIEARADERKSYVLQLKSFKVHLEGYSCHNKHPHRKLILRFEKAIKELEQPVEDREVK